MSYYAYMSDEVPETFTMVLAGREITFRTPLLGQILVLNRMAQRGLAASKDGPDEQRTQAMTTSVARTLDFIETLIVSEQDKVFVEDQMLAGTIDWQDVMKALAGGRDRDETPDDEAPKPIKRAPKKSPKAASVDLTGKKPAQIVAKPVATRGRAKR